MTNAKIYIRLKKAILDPQGETIKTGLSHLGFKGIADCRMGKMVEITLETDNKTKAKAEVEEMCKKLLANPIIEDFEVVIK